MKHGGYNFNAISQSRVVGDEFLLHHAITNLLKNAVDFSPQGGLIKISQGGDQGSQQQVIIEDSGPGIPTYALSQIYDRFYSLAHPNRSSKGSGLGLAFVKEVAELHQGSIKVSNGAGGGVRAELSIA